MPTLVEPFRRIESGGGGVGLGLSIAQSVSTAHGAELDVRSQPEGGLRVSVILPRAHVMNRGGGIRSSRWPA